MVSYGFEFLKSKSLSINKIYARTGFMTKYLRCKRPDSVGPLYLVRSTGSVKITKPHVYQTK